jgi:polar amino acid transport system ATP-binding protein
MLTITNVTKKFGSRTVLNNVSLKLDKGTVTVFLGASGVGKSTLLRILSGLETPDQGTISFDGIPLHSMTQEHTVGMVFQQFNIFEHLTVLENITLPLEKVLGKNSSQAQQIAQQLLKQYGLGDKQNVYAAQLSGGQKQRLAIARALAMEPRIICFDEPTSALDPRLTNSVAQQIQELARKGLTVLVATHDVSLLERLECTVHLMENGTIVQTATSSQLRQHPDQYPLMSRFVQGNEPL